MNEEENSSDETKFKDDKQLKKINQKKEKNCIFNLDNQIKCFVLLMIIFVLLFFIFLSIGQKIMILLLCILSIITLIILIILLIIKLRKKTNVELGEEKKEKVIPLFNPKLELLPTITLVFDCDCTINEELYDKLKEELSEIIDKNNFSIIELQRGSAISKIVLLSDLGKKGIRASVHHKTSDDITSVLKKIELKKFACLGNNYASTSRYNIPDYSKEENRKQLVNFLKESSKTNEDLLQAAATISDEEFDNILESIDNVSNTVIKQEINQKKFILKNLEEFNNQIESILEQKKKESIFEFCVAGLSLIDRNKEDYQRYKDNCNNVITTILFHGTSTNASSLITTSNFRQSNTTFFGPGIYMTDMLDYAGFYAYESGHKFQNHQRIRNINETFSIVASQVFYDNSKLENCYNKTQNTIQKDGIRFVHVNARGGPLSQENTKENGYNKFIGTEFVIPSENQILPLYSITLKRSEYYCLWKDYHFTHQTSYTEHALHVKNIAKQLLGINIYGVGEFEEALDIIKRKKYNKVILLSNVGNDINRIKNFINEIRTILKFKVIVLFFTSTTRHLQWIKDFPNALFTTQDNHFKDYILNFNKRGLNNLKKKIEIDYGQKLDNFHADLSYPLFDEAKSENYSSISID